MSQRQYARAMPPKQQPQQRIPQPSIKSSQVFSQQSNQRQTFQRQQPNQQNQRYHQQQDYFDDASSEKESVMGQTATKMTITQAITLITLRLGSIETKLMNMDNQNYGSSSVNSFSDNNLIERLEELENKINANYNSNDNLNYKQQIDSLTQTLIQFKNSTNLLSKENKEIKNQLTNYKREIEDLKKSLENVKELAISNQTKILQMLTINLENDDVENITDYNENTNNDVVIENSNEINIISDISIDASNDTISIENLENNNHNNE